MHPVYAAERLLAHEQDGGVAPFSPASLFTEAQLFSVPVLLLILVAATYAYGVSRLNARGDRWPASRSVLFGIGLAVLAIALVSGLAAYDETLFSAHMVQHMLLSMVAPIFLALGAPVTLALRTLPGRPRSTLLTILHSRFAKVITFPILPFVLFVASPYALYFSGWYPATLDSRLLHELLHVHFVIVGCLFFWPLIGLDPLPGRAPYPFRALLMFLSMPIHAVLGLTIMESSTLLAGEHYLELGLDWTDPASDQRVGGGLLWGSGDLVSLLMLGALIVQWIKASEREAVREDRRLDRLEALEAHDEVAG